MEADDIVLPTGADVVAALDRDAQEVADEEDQETTIADAMADAKEAVAKEEGAASGAASTRVADDEPEEAPTRKKMRSAEAEAGPAEAAPAAASTRGPARRQAMKSRIIVQKEGSSEKYSLVCAATQMEAEIDRALESRAAAILDEARESFGASTPEDARLRLVQAGRACVVTGSRGRLNYLVIDGQLQKRSRFYIFRDWAQTRDGHWWLHKQDRDRQWLPLPVESDSGGPWTIPRESNNSLQHHAGHVFGGQTWLDVLSQLGGCPCKFVDCWNLIIKQRLEAAISPRLVCHAGASTPSS